MDSIINDIRFAVRSLINAVLLRPLPYRDADRVVTLWQNNTKAGNSRNEVSPANFLDWKEQSRSFETLAGIEPFGFSLVGDGEPERLSAWLVTSGFFQIAGTDALLGRTFSDEDYQPGNNRVVVLGHGLWQRRFGGDPNIIGRKLTFSGQPYIVVGVMPPEFQLPADREIWVPRIVGENLRQLRGATYWNVVGRLKPGTTVAQAQEEMNGIAARMAAQYPDSNGGMGVSVVPLFEQITGSIRSALWVLFAAVGFVLLIACVNVANLLLVRGAERQREFAIRRALGAERIRLLRQTLTESLLLVLVGGVTGVLLASWLVKLIPALSSSKIPRVEYVGPAAQLASVKRAIREVNPNQTFARTATMEELVSDSLKQRRFNLFLLGLFAAIALLLATLGIYGSISYSTRQRTNEIGVRIALGAQTLDVLRLIVGQGVGLALVGVVIGLSASFLLTRTIKTLLFGVTPTDPLTFLAISLLLLVTAFIASLIPARRATKVDPLIALRAE